MLWEKLIRSLDARWLLLRPAHLGVAEKAGLARVGATRVSTVAEAELWAVGDARPVDASSAP